MARIYAKSSGTWNSYNAKEIYFNKNGVWTKGSFSQLNGLNYLYENIDGNRVMHYVSLGDSIAAAQSINDGWAVNYGFGSQIGNNGNIETAIVPKSYTDLYAEDLRATCGAGNVSVKNYSHSGDEIEQMMGRLNMPNVVSALQEADIVTICIGANSVLQPAMSKLEEYATAGDATLAEIKAIVNAKLAQMADDNYDYSITALLNRLYSINPDATYIFTTIYNPYKYLWLDDGANGFFKPLLDSIPQMNIDVDGAIEDIFNIDDLGYYDITQFKWKSIELNYDLDDAIRNGLLNTPIVRLLYSRVNGLGAYTEDLVTRLNDTLITKISAYGKANLKIADTKSQFDLIPDRTTPGDVHYNDLVNVEFTRGYTTTMMDWEALMRDKYGTSQAGVQQYWLDLAWKYLSFNNAAPSLNVADYVNFDINGFADDLINQVIDKVIVPNVDAHPEEYGHYVFKHTFAGAFDVNSITRKTVSFNPGSNGSGTMAACEFSLLDANLAFTLVLPKNTFSPHTGYYFTGWLGSDGKTYTDGATISVKDDLTLTAQWSNIYTVIYMHSNHTNLYGDDETGHQECFEFWINGAQQHKFGKFKDKSYEEYKLAYGTPIGAICRCYNPTELTYDDKTCRIYVNDIQLAEGYREVAANIPGGVLGNMIIDFRWKIAGSIATLNAQSWYDCHITIL